MPIVRTYACDHCGHFMEVTLRADQWQEPAPACPLCATERMAQEFHPPAIGGSTYGKARKIAETIAAEDYHVADIQSESRSGPRVRYQDTPAGASTWMASGPQLQQAMALGRETRIRHGSGLDVLQHNLRTGVQPDLIELSKRRSMKVW